MVGESEVSTVLTLNKAVNELISLNLHLCLFSDDGEGNQRFYFEQDADEDSFEVIVNFFDGQLQFVDFVNHLNEYADTYPLYSAAVHSDLSEEEAVKQLRESYFLHVASYYETRRDRLVESRS